MEIPPYPAARPLALSDKPLLDRLFSDILPHVSELTFAGLYLFRNTHRYRVAKAADSIVVLGNGYDGSEYFLPPLGGDVAEALGIMFAAGMSLYGADDPFVDRYLAANTLHISEQRDSFDYLYLREELATLQGSRFHKKKNRINYFTRRHEYSVDIFSSGHLDGCLNLLDRWFQSSRNDIGQFSIMDVEATAEALHSAEALGLEGVVVITGGHVAAFALGEQLNKDTAVCHFEKADPFMEGLYQLVNREFARLLFQECQFLNREQDLGDMGLRSAKLSYHPVELVKKYLVTPLDRKDFVVLCKKT